MQQKKYVWERTMVENLPTEERWEDPKSSSDHWVSIPRETAKYNILNRKRSSERNTNIIVTCFIEVLQLDQENLITTTHIIFEFEPFHTVHLDISNFLKKCALTYPDSDIRNSHLGIKSHRKTTGYNMHVYYLSWKLDTRRGGIKLVDAKSLYKLFAQRVVSVA